MSATAHGSAVGIGLETTPGTAVSRTVWIAVVSVENNETPTRTPIGTINPSSAFDTGHALTDRSAGFTINGRMSYRQLGMFLRAALGAVATTGSSSPYTHTYTHALALPSLTVESLIGTTGDSHLYSGVKINTLNVTCEREWVNFSAECIALNVTVTTSTSVGTIVIDSYIPHTHVASVAWGSYTWGPSNTNGIRSLTLQIANNLQGAGRVGSVTPATLYRGGSATATLELELDYDDDALRTSAISATGSPNDATLTITDGTNSIVVVLHNAIAQSYGPPTIELDLLSETITLAGRLNGADLGCEIAVTNTQSSYDA